MVSKQALAGPSKSSTKSAQHVNMRMVSSSSAPFISITLGREQGSLNGGSRHKAWRVGNMVVHSDCSAMGFECCGKSMTGTVSAFLFALRFSEKNNLVKRDLISFHFGIRATSATSVVICGVEGSFLVIPL